MRPAELQAVDCSGGNTGPFRRVWSLAGFSWMSAEIYLPSITAGEIRYNAAGDTAYIYSGGWGLNGEAVDAGFQHNTGTDNWSLFIKYEGLGLQFAQDSPRFSSGQKVQLTFLVPQDGALRAVASGALIDGQTQTIVVDMTVGANGWSLSGNGQVLKRMTSIAQFPQDLASGSFLHNVQWNNVQIGTTMGSKVPWLSAQTGGQCMHPTQEDAPNVIQVTFFDQGHEIDNITLS